MAIHPHSLIQIHFASDFWRKLGTWTYAAVLIEWLPIAGVIYLLQEPILQHEIALTTPFLIMGAVLIAARIALHAWTAKLLGIKATISYTELKSKHTAENQDLITSGPFGVVRHPSYWAHTAIIIGIFLITGAAALE